MMICSQMRSTSCSRCEETDDGDPVGSPEALHEQKDLRLTLGIEPVGGFVEEHDFGSCTIACASFSRCLMPVE